jgi:hypothetical protein
MNPAPGGLQEVDGLNHRGERFMFSLADGRVMFLDPEVGKKIEALGINARENFTITRKWDEEKGTPFPWEVARLASEQPNGTFVVPAAPSKPPASASTAAADAARRQPAASPWWRRPIAW